MKKEHLIKKQKAAEELARETRYMKEQHRIKHLQAKKQEQEMIANLKKDREFKKLEVV